MEFKDTIIASYPTGSRYICDPPVMDTDNDTVILVNGYYDWEQMLLQEGWERGGSDHGEGDFKAFRLGENNYIVTEDEVFYFSYVKATEGAKALNLLNKEDRINLFRAVLGSGNTLQDSDVRGANPAENEAFAAHPVADNGHFPLQPGWRRLRWDGARDGFVVIDQLAVGDMEVA